MPTRIRPFSSRWRSSGEHQIWSVFFFFLPLVSGGGSDKLRVIDLAGVLKADGSLSPSPPVLGDGVKANLSGLELLLLAVERPRLVEDWYYRH